MKLSFFVSVYVVITCLYAISLKAMDDADQVHHVVILFPVIALETMPTPEVTLASASALEATEVTFAHVPVIALEAMPASEVTLASAPAVEATDVPMSAVAVVCAPDPNPASTIDSDFVQQQKPYNRERNPRCCGFCWVFSIF